MSLAVLMHWGLVRGVKFLLSGMGSIPIQMTRVFEGASFSGVGPSYHIYKLMLEESRKFLHHIAFLNLIDLFNYHIKKSSLE
jgi:hypothetical protein